MALFPMLKKDTSEEFYTSLEQFMEEVQGTVTALKSATEQYCNGNLGKVKEHREKVIQAEKKADTIRQDMERAIYSGVLIPFGLEDKYELLDSIDDIADRAELIVRLAGLERPKVPEKIKADLKKLVAMVETCVSNLKLAISYLNKDLDKAIKEAKTVEQDRDKVRDLEFKLLEKLFSSHKNGLKTWMIKELITLIGQIADKAEESADRVVTLAVKYKA